MTSHRIRGESCKVGKECSGFILGLTRSRINRGTEATRGGVPKILVATGYDWCIQGPNLAERELP